MEEAKKDFWSAALESLSDEDRQWATFDGQNKLDVLSKLSEIVVNAKDKTVKERWSFNRHGEAYILRDCFGKIEVWLDRFKNIGDIVAQFDPVHASLPWAGVRFLLEV